MVDMPRDAPSADRRTKDRLLQAALLEFTEKGYYGTNADSITKRARVGHGTFYLYYKNKNEALTELLYRSTDLPPYTAYRTDPRYLLHAVHDRTELQQALQEFIRPLAERPELLKAFTQGMLQDEEVFDLARHVARQIAGQFLGVILNAQKAGARMGGDAQILAAIISICVTTSILMMVMEIMPCTPGDLARNLAGIIAPVLFPVAPRGKPVRLRAALPENDARIRRDLLAAAQEEFVAHGYFAAKVSNIAQRAGYSRGTFYLYYKDKDDLLEAIVEEMLGIPTRSDRLSSTHIDDLDTGSIDALARLVMEGVNTLDTPINWAVLQGFFNSPKLNRLYKDIFALYSDPIVRKITALQAQDKCTGIDASLAASIILATVSYSAFLRNIQVIPCTKRKYAATMAWLLFAFLNHPHSGT